MSASLCRESMFPLSARIGTGPSPPRSPTARRSGAIEDGVSWVGRADVGSRGAAEAVVAHPVRGVQEVVAVASDEAVGAGAGENGVGAEAPELPVAAAAADQPVVIGPTGEAVAVAAP